MATWVRDRLLNDISDAASAIFGRTMEISVVAGNPPAKPSRSVPGRPAVSVEGEPAPARRPRTAPAPRPDKLIDTTFSAADFRAETRSLAEVSWWRNYRVWGGVLLVLCMLILIIFR